MKNQYEMLEKIFHEPNRLAIMSALCAADKGLSFNELKEQCALTDGNLNRHLKTIEEAGVIKITKKFVKNKPRTTVVLSRQGLNRFNEYLTALSAVIKKAQSAVADDQKSPAPLVGEIIHA